MNDKHRCSRVLRWWGAVLLCLAALPPATASPPERKRADRAG